MRKPVMPDTTSRLHKGCYSAMQPLCGRSSTLLVRCLFLVCIANTRSCWQLVGAQTSAAFECGVPVPGSKITMAGSWVVAPIATVWATSYRQQCPDAGEISIEQSGNDEGMARLCSVANGQRSADIAMLSRIVRSDEAQLQSDGVTYRCIIGDTRRTFVQLDVALDGLALVTPTGSSSDLCIRQIGGLSRNQLRWMFSNYTESQLLATGWDATSIGNSDNNPETRQWCELLNDPLCPCDEIRLAGTPNGTQPHQYMGQFTFGDYLNGETFNEARYFSSSSDFDIIRHLDDTGGAIAYLRVPDFESNSDVLSAASILGTKGIFVPPTGSTLQSGEYTYSRRVYMNLIVSDAVSYRATHPFLHFGYSPFGSSLVKAVELVPIPDDEIPTLLSRISDQPTLCFSGQNTVVVRGKGTITIEELQLDDYVHVGEGTYSKVISFGHFLPNGIGSFLLIESQHSRIEISPLHLLYVGGQLRAAKDATVGDFLGDNDKITSITMVRSRGIYAPMTESGQIAVSGVVASSYVALWNIPPSLMHYVSHWTLAPLRICRALKMTQCIGESYNDLGIASQYVNPIRALDWVTTKSSSSSIQLAVLVVLPLLFCFRLLEALLSMRWAILPALYGGYWLCRPKGKRSG